jgi:nicotinamide riboside kinase
MTFHPQTNGQTERVNGILNRYLRNYVVIDHKDWGHKFDLAKFCYNCTKHLTTHMNPFEFALVMKVKQPLDLIVPCTMGYHKDGGKNAEIIVEERKKLKAHAKKLLEDAQARYEK